MIQQPSKTIEQFARDLGGTITWCKDYSKVVFPTRTKERTFLEECNKRKLSWIMYRDYIVFLNY
jgi:hypothetical protein